MESLRDIAKRTDATVAAARSELVAAIREASRNGMTQTEIARATGRSQPEINRLLRFHGTSPLGMRLRKNLAAVRDELEAAGAANLRVFGSVSRGEDDEKSDIDLLVNLETPMSLMQISALENRLADILEARVDLVLERSLRPDIKDDIIATAVPL